MALTETSLIERYFRAAGAQRSDVTLGIGDDAAILSVPPGSALVASTDTLVAGVHFPHGSPAASIGHRALAVNLSDLAAMGARPAWALLALTLPEAQEAWLQEFSAGLGALAQEYRVALVGGDTTRGPLVRDRATAGPRANGRSAAAWWRARRAMRCSSPARPGMRPPVSPSSSAASRPRARRATYLRERFLLPSPRVALGERLREYASACIDVSDGLLGDAGKLAQASGVARGGALRGVAGLGSAACDARR